jgi:hypothetical protein
MAKWKYETRNPICYRLSDSRESNFFLETKDYSLIRDLLRNLRSSSTPQVVAVKYISLHKKH